MKMLAIDAQVEALHAPQDMGEYGSVSINQDCLDWASDVLHNITDAGQVPLPYLYATPESGVQAEWTFGPWEVMAKFDYDERSVSLLAVNARTGMTTDEIANLTSEDWEDSVAAFVNSFSNGGES